MSDAAAFVRKAISKRVRFEVFKRDGFECQYCGATPPGVMLHVDHIVPVARGGGNDMDNLLTACQPCNSGKGAVELSVVPQSLKEKAAEIAEREAQLAAYQEVLEARRERLEDEVWRVMRALKGENVESVLNSEFQGAKRFVERLGVYEVLEAAEIARAKKPWPGPAFRYFCGICWNRIRDSEDA